MSKYGELINVRSLSPMVRLSAASGLMWALIAWFIGYRVFGDRIWGGIVVAPLIGILIGRLSWPLRTLAAGSEEHATTVFWAPYYYRNVFRTYLPWVLVGGGMIGVPRLIGGRR